MISVIDEHHLRVGDRVWWGEFNSADYEIDDLELHGWKHRQFLVHFESKWWVSVVWSYCTYSDNHDAPFMEPDLVFNETPTLVEAAVLHHDREGLQPDGDPFAYIDAEQLNALLSLVSNLPTDADISSWPT